MSKVYRVGSLYGTTYHNTAREAARKKPGGEEPESVDRLDAAAECDRLHALAGEWESLFGEARVILIDLVDALGSDARLLEPGRRAAAFVASHPLPPATAGDRDGQRSYGI